MADPVFIFMLTRQDSTVPDAALVVREALAAGVRHVGFKDVGGPPDLLAGLAEAIRAAGGTSYLEIVSLDAALEAAAAELAVEIGVDCLLGGVHPRVVAPRLRGAALRYFPFAGEVAGHPSVLRGDCAAIAASAAEIAAIDGVDGLDLLAYRSGCDAGQLMGEVCRAAGKPVIIAGSIDCADRIAAVRRAGAWGFTVGTAALEGAFAAPSPGLPDQLAAIEAARLAA
jgi:hypothetical protein